MPRLVGPCRYDSGGRTQVVNSLSNASLAGGSGGKADRRTTFSAIKVRDVPP